MEDYAKYREDNVRPKGGFMFYPYTLYAIPGNNVPLHWHEEIEIMYTKADGILILDGKKIEYCSDDIFFFNSRQLHSTYHTTAGWAYHILIHPDMLGSRYILDNNDICFHFPEKIRPDDKLCRQIIEDWLKIPEPISDINKLLIMKTFYELLHHLMEEGYTLTGNEQEVSVQSSYIKSAIDYISNNIYHKIPVQSIADYVGISKEHLMRLFKQYTGNTINSHIQSQRLEAAGKDLADGYSLTDIINKYDYTDTAYFCRLFKNHYGISPGKIKGNPHMYNSIIHSSSYNIS